MSFRGRTSALEPATSKQLYQDVSVNGGTLTAGATTLKEQITPIQIPAQLPPSVLQSSPITPSLTTVTTTPHTPNVPRGVMTERQQLAFLMRAASEDEPKEKKKEGKYMTDEEEESDEDEEEEDVNMTQNNQTSNNAQDDDDNSSQSSSSSDDELLLPAIPPPTTGSKRASSTTPSADRSSDSSSNNNTNDLHPRAIRHPREYALWSAEKQKRWNGIHKNPNLFYYHHLPPGVTRAPSGSVWTQKERTLFLYTIGHHPPDGEWGLFSMNVPGRTGKECEEYAKALEKQGLLSITPGKRGKPAQVKLLRESSGSKKKGTTSAATSIPSFESTPILVSRPSHPSRLTTNLNAKDLKSYQSSRTSELITAIAGLNLTPFPGTENLKVDKSMRVETSQTLASLLKRKVEYENEMDENSNSAQANGVNSGSGNDKEKKASKPSLLAQDTKNALKRKEKEQKERELKEKEKERMQQQQQQQLLLQQQQQAERERLERERITEREKSIALTIQERERQVPMTPSQGVQPGRKGVRGSGSGSSSVTSVSNASGGNKKTAAHQAGRKHESTIRDLSASLDAVRKGKSSDEMEVQISSMPSPGTKEDAPTATQQKRRGKRDAASLTNAEQQDDESLHQDEDVQMEDASASASASAAFLSQFIPPLSHSIPSKVASDSLVTPPPNKPQVPILPFAKFTIPAHTPYAKVKRRKLELDGLPTQSHASAFSSSTSGLSYCGSIPRLLSQPTPAQALPYRAARFDENEAQHEMVLDTIAPATAGVKLVVKDMKHRARVMRDADGRVHHAAATTMVDDTMYDDADFSSTPTSSSASSSFSTELASLETKHRLAVRRLANEHAVQLTRLRSEFGVPTPSGVTGEVNESKYHSFTRLPASALAASTSSAFQVGCEVLKQGGYFTQQTTSPSSPSSPSTTDAPPPSSSPTTSSLLQRCRTYGEAVFFLRSNHKTLLKDLQREYSTGRDVLCSLKTTGLLQ